MLIPNISLYTPDLKPLLSATLVRDRFGIKVNVVDKKMKLTSNRARVAFENRSSQAEADIACTEITCHCYHLPLDHFVPPTFHGLSPRSA